MTPAQLRVRGIDLVEDAQRGSIIRSVVMKLEHAPLIPTMQRRVSMWSGRANAAARRA